MYLISWIYLIGSLGCALSFAFSHLFLSRFFLGLAVGASSAIIPLYLAEISSSKDRGRMVGLNQLMIVAGQFLSFLCNAILGNAFADNIHIWKYMMGIAMIPALIMIIGMSKVFESPKWLAKNGLMEKAVDIIRKLYSDPDKQEGMISELHTIELESVQEKCKIPKWAIKVLIIGCLLGIIQQFAGINAIMYYGSEILNMYGFSEKSALIFNVLNGVICVIASLVGMLIVDRLGRKKLESFGLGICMLSLILVGLTSQFLQNEFTPYIILVLIFIYIFSFQGAVGPVTWILISEIFPKACRGTFSGIAVFILWVANFCVGLFFPVLVTSIGILGFFPLRAEQYQAVFAVFFYYALQ
jgi:MFS transporter, SP family, major inositol transporter